MKIYNYNVPDDLIYHYAYMIQNGASISRLIAHEKIFIYLFKHYAPFKRHYTELYGNKYEGEHINIEYAQSHVEHEDDDMKEVCYFVMELDKVIQRILEKPTLKDRRELGKYE